MSTLLRKWASAFAIVLLVISFLALLAGLVLCGILPGEFIRAQ